MPKLHEKVAATGFKVTTGMTPDQIIAKADDAAQRASGMVDKISRTSRSPYLIEYAIKRAGLKTIGTFEVRISAAPSPHEVSFEPGEYVSVQSKFMFIPVGPKTSAALAPFKRFSQVLRGSLGAGA